jgi:CHASE1-domain containing sensor protein
MLQIKKKIMNTNTVLAIFIVFVFSSLIIAFSFEKDEHQKRMDLIEEKKELVDLQKRVELEQTIQWADSLALEIDKQLN